MNSALRMPDNNAVHVHAVSCGSDMTPMGLSAWRIDDTDELRSAGVIMFWADWTYALTCSISSSSISAVTTWCRFICCLKCAILIPQIWCPGCGSHSGRLEVRELIALFATIWKTSDKWTVKTAQTGEDKHWVALSLSRLVQKAHTFRRRGLHWQTRLQLYCRMLIDESPLLAMILCRQNI